MPPVEQGSLLLPAPGKEQWPSSQMGRFLLGIEQKYGRTFADYEEAWQWSVDHLEDFWGEVWDHFDIISHSPYTAVLAERTMPGARWFPGATLNYTEHIVRSLGRRTDHIMVKSRSQTNGSIDWTGGRLLEEIGRIQQGLLRHGIKPGDRVAGYLPNIPQTLAAYLATTALGAIWCSVPPEMGPKSVLDRITQLEPALILAIDGYRWGKRELSRADDLARIREFLPGTATVLLPYLNDDAEAPAGAELYADFTRDPGEVHCEPVPFDHPLTVLFSSGTTGKPKAIVHSHGGLLLEHFKAMGLHFDMSEADTAFWFTTTGWMVWTLSVSTLLMGAALVLEDGDPNWPGLDGDWSQWAILAQTEATYLGTGAAYLAACAHAGLEPAKKWDLSRLREIQCSGSPLAADVAGWVYTSVNPDLLLAPTSGGTDICAAFIGASPLTAVYAGEMSCRPLGVAVESWDPEGRPVRGTAGELVATKPMPSMPVFFWGDENFERYRNSYFGAYEGVWRHGDWLIRDRPQQLDHHRSLRCHAEPRRSASGHSRVLRRTRRAAGRGRQHGAAFRRRRRHGQAGAAGGGGRRTPTMLQLEAAIRNTLRAELSPRHIPDYIVFVPSIPRNPTGKRLEIPLKRIIQGAVLGEVIDLGVVVRPEDIDDTVRRVHRVLEHS